MTEPRAWALVHSFEDGSAKPLVVRIYLDEARARADAALPSGDVFPAGEKYRAHSYEFYLLEAPLVGEPPRPQRYSLDEIDRMRAAVRQRLELRSPLSTQSTWSMHCPTPAETEDELRTLLGAGVDVVQVEAAAAADCARFEAIAKAEREGLRGGTSDENP